MVVRVMIPRRMEVAMIPANESMAAPGDAVLFWSPRMALLRLDPASIVALFIPSDIIVYLTRRWDRQTDLQEMRRKTSMW